MCYVGGVVSFRLLCGNFTLLAIKFPDTYLVSSSLVVIAVSLLW